MTSLQDFNASPSFISNNTRYGGGQAAGANTDIVPEGTQSAGRRVDNSTNKGIGVSIPQTNLGSQHIKIWNHVIQIGLVTNLQAVIASGTGTNNVDYHTLPVPEYNPALRYLPLWVEVDRAPEGGGGANSSAINEIGARMTIGDVGGNAQNFILDEILYGDGLLFDGAAGDFEAFRDYESTNSEGVLLTVIGTDFCFARIKIGSATSTSFTDSGFNITYPAQSLVASDFMGVTFDLQNAGTSIDLSDGTFRAQDVSGTGNRPDFIVSGTAGTLTLNSVNALGMRLILLNSSAIVTGGIYDGLDLTQGGSTISGAIIRPRTTSGIAMIDDADFSKLSEINFIQSGQGHAVEITAPGTYGLSSLEWDGFGADGSNSAAIYNNSGGLVTLNISGGGTPTVRNGAGASTAINNAVAVTLTNVEPGTKIKVFRISDNVELAGVDSSGTSFVAALDAGVAVTFRLVSLFRRISEFDLTVPGTDTTIPISQQQDRVFLNP